MFGRVEITKKKQNLLSYRTEKKEANDEEINEYVHAEYFLSYN